MNIALWLVQALLAFAFLAAGGMKLAMPVETLIENGMNYANHTPWWLVKFIGLAEVAGALGLVLPAATKIQPKLTPIAASALVVVMALAAVTHVALGEWGALVPPLVLGSLAAFVAWGRFKAVPIHSGGTQLAEA